MVLFGLDFGTTFSSLAVLKDGVVYLVKQQNSAYLPTYLLLSETKNTVSYGYDAESDSAKSASSSFFRDLKRWVGCDEGNLETYKAKLKPHYLVELGSYGSGDKQCVFLREFTGVAIKPQPLAELIARFVQCFVRTAEELLNCTCTGLICSVPQITTAYNVCSRKAAFLFQVTDAFTC